MGLGGIRQKPEQDQEDSVDVLDIFGFKGQLELERRELKKKMSASTPVISTSHEWETAESKTKAPTPPASPWVVDDAAILAMYKHNVQALRTQRQKEREEEQMAKGPVMMTDPIKKRQTKNSLY